MASEDYHGRYWHVTHTSFLDRIRRVYSHMCADCSCLWGVEIQRDVLGQFYARHEHSDHNPVLHTGPSTVTSPRYEHWQEAAEWAEAHGLLGP